MVIVGDWSLSIALSVGTVELWLCPRSLREVVVERGSPHVELKEGGLRLRTSSNEVVVPQECRDYPGEPERNLGVDPQLVSGGAVPERGTGGFGWAGLNMVSCGSPWK
jgi:hypothetical protein